MVTALICLNYNDSETTISFISSIVSFGSISKIIVVDNCSTDDSYEKMSIAFENYERVYLIKTNRNGGYAYGNNRGVEYAVEHFSPDYLVISNPDVLFEESVLCNLIDAANSDNKTAIVTCKMLDRNKNISNLCYWDLPKSWLKESFSYLFPVSKKARFFPESGIINVDVVPGSFFVIKADIFQEVGLFDEGTFLYYEENILSFKLKQNGFLTKVVMDHIFIHNHSVTINKSIKKIKQFKLLMKSSEYYWKKYYRVSSFAMFFIKVLHSIAILERRCAYMLKKN